MSTHSLIHDAAVKFEVSLNNDPMLDVLSARVLNLIGESIEQLKGRKKDTVKLASLSDELLLSEIVTMLSTKRAMVSERELNKQKKRVIAKQEFFKMLEQHGGLYKAGDVAQILNVSRQTINNQRTHNKLLSISDGNDYLYPAFQFTESTKLEHFDLILNELEGMDSITKCSFFINKINIVNKLISPLNLLKCGVNKKELTDLKREAHLFGTSTPS
jgi:hypothetical protein